MPAIMDPVMGHYYRDDVVAQAMAMVMMGYTGERIARDLPGHFPGEDTPSARTVQVWAKELDLQIRYSGAGGGVRTRTSLRTADFKSAASADSATPAQSRL